MPSQIVPSLVAALVATVFVPADATDSPSALSLYPKAVRAQAAEAAALADDGWAWRSVPTFNLALALVVFLYLVEDRCGQEISAWVNELTRGRYSCAAVQPVALAEKHDATGAAAAASRGMGPVERAILVGSTLTVMLSMLFFSNGVFDAYAASVGPYAHGATLLDVAARFSSFSILVVFLALTLLLVLFAPSPRTTLPPLLFLLAPVLLSSTLASRFSLGLRSAAHSPCARSTMPLAHWALLVGEPLVLVAIQAWMMVGAGGQRSGQTGLSSSADEERVVGTARAGVDEKAPVVLIVVTEHA